MDRPGGPAGQWGWLRARPGCPRQKFCVISWGLEGCGWHFCQKGPGSITAPSLPRLASLGGLPNFSGPPFVQLCSGEITAPPVGRREE